MWTYSVKDRDDSSVLASYKIIPIFFSKTGRWVPSLEALMHTTIISFDFSWMARPRSTRQTSFARNYCVELSNAKINRFCDGFFPSTSRPLELPRFFRISGFLRPSFLPSKGRSIITLGTRWHDFFYYPFRYFMNLFYSFHCLFLSFLKGCRLEKGHIVPPPRSHS